MKRFVITLSIFLLPLLLSAQDDRYIELEKRIEVEIRGTHILFAQLLQSEIEGQFESLGKVYFTEIKSEDRFVARSIINSYKTFETLKHDIEAAIDRLKNSNKMTIVRDRVWTKYSKEEQIWTSWTVTDNTSNAKLYFEVLYSIPDDKIHITTYPYNFETSSKNMLKPGYYIGLFSGWKQGGPNRHSWLKENLREKLDQNSLSISCIIGLDKTKHNQIEIERYRKKNPRFLTTNNCEKSREVFIGPFASESSMRIFFEENKIETIDLHLFESFYKCRYTCVEL